MIEFNREELGLLRLWVREKALEARGAMDEYLEQGELVPTYIRAEAAVAYRLWERLDNHLYGEAEE